MCNTLILRETPKLTPRDHYLRTSRYLPGQVTRINSNNNNVNDLFGSRQNSSVKSSKYGTVPGRTRCSVLFGLISLNMIQNLKTDWQMTVNLFPSIGIYKFILSESKLIFSPINFLLTLIGRNGLDQTLIGQILFILLTNGKKGFQEFNYAFKNSKKSESKLIFNLDNTWRYRSTAPLMRSTRPTGAQRPIQAGALPGIGRTNWTAK